MESFIVKFKNLKSQTDSSSYLGREKYQSVVLRLESLTRKAYGLEHNFYKKIYPLKLAIKKQFGWSEKSRDLNNLLDIIIDDLETSERLENEVNKGKKLPQNAFKRRPSDILSAEINSIITEKNKQVFIVHGHNEEIKQSVARTIEKIGLKPIILHEQSKNGKTIIENIAQYSNVGFAIILYSSDDFGFSKRGGNEKIKPRARQNVIFEHGFFTAKIGRGRVVAIVENNSEIELPSDINGLLHISYSINGSWKFDLARELKANGYKVDLNNLM